MNETALTLAQRNSQPDHKDVIQILEKYQREQPANTTDKQTQLIPGSNACQEWNNMLCDGCMQDDGAKVNKALKELGSEAARYYINAKSHERKGKGKVAMPDNFGIPTWVSNCTCDSSRRQHAVGIDPGLFYR